MTGGKGSSCMWLGTDTGSVCQVQLTTPHHIPCATPIIATVVSLGLQHSHRPSGVPHFAASQNVFPSPKALPPAPHPSPAHFWSPVIEQSTARLMPSKAGSIKDAISTKQQADSTHRQQPTEERSSSTVRLKRVSPFSQVLERWDAHTHALHHPKTGAAVHSITASAGSPAIPQPALSYQVEDSHRLPEAGPCQLAHDGPVQHILTANDRVVTSGGVGAKCTLREWSCLGKLTASHKTCEKGTAAIHPEAPLSETPCPCCACLPSSHLLQLAYKFSLL